MHERAGRLRRLGSVGVAGEDADADAGADDGADVGAEVGAVTRGVVSMTTSIGPAGAAGMRFAGAPVDLNP